MGSITKVFQLLQSKEKFTIYFIFFLSILAALFEMLGIALILPVLTVLLKGTFDNLRIFSLDIDLNFLKDFIETDILYIGIIILIIVFVLKNIFLIFFSFYNNRYISTVSARISSAMFLSYLKKNFDYHLDTNTSVMLKNCNFIVDRFKITLSNIIVAFSELSVLAGITFLLLVIETKGFLICSAIFGSLSFLIFILTDKFNERWGQKIQDNETERLLHLLQGFNAIKEIKVFNKVKFFFKKFLPSNTEKARITYLHGAVSSLPKYIIEVFFVLTLSFLLLFLKFNDKTNQDIVIIMGVFAVAAIRVIPSMNKLLIARQRFKFGEAAVEVLFDELYTTKSSNIQNNTDSRFRKNGKTDQNYLIRLENVFYKYNSSEEYTLKNVNFTLKKEKFIGIIGETGSGKSTLINLILNLLEPTKGKVYSNFNSISFVPQAPYLIDDTIINNVAIGVEEEKINLDLVKKCLEDVQLKNFVDTLPNGINTIVGERAMRISGGELQRLAIARSLYIVPDLLIFDEPTSSLDPDTEKKIMEIIKTLSKKISVILITHDRQNLKYCDEIFEIKNQQVILKEKKKTDITGKN